MLLEFLLAIFTRMDQLSCANNRIINPKELIRYSTLILQSNIRTIFYNLVGYN